MKHDKRCSLAALRHMQECMHILFYKWPIFIHDLEKTGVGTDCLNFSHEQVVIITSMERCLDCYASKEFDVRLVFRNRVADGGACDLASLAEILCFLKYSYTPSGLSCPVLHGRPKIREPC